MADTFISYSRKDSEPASQLVEALRSLGADVWIDRTAIEAATSWSAEIVTAIDSCSVFLLLLSRHSVSSENVVREVALAFESGRRIMPVTLEDVVLPPTLRYQLAGLQHAAITDIGGLVRALDRLGLRLSPPEQAPQPAAHPHLRPRLDAMRLAVLPFDDLSPQHDNDWFADGMMDELINTLGSLEQLLVNPRTDVNYYKGKKPKLDELTAELRCRYVVEGAVQKSGTKIRVRVSLSDAVEHVQLWSEKYDGTFDDIFDFQEKTALAIANALRLKLAPEDKKRIEMKPTENAEAYELYLRAMYYDNRNTKSDSERAMDLGRQAVALDPTFALALSCLGYTYLGYYRNYDRSPQWLDLADEAIQRSLNLRPDVPHTYSVLGVLHLHRGDSDAAVEAAKRATELEPASWSRWFHLGFVYMSLGDAARSAEAYEQSILRDPKAVPSYFNLAIMYDKLDDPVRRKDAALRGIRYVSESVRRNPDDQSLRLNYAVLLLFAERTDESLAEMDSILRLPDVDSNTYYNAACIYLNLGDNERGMTMLEAAVDAGFRNVEVLKVTLEHTGFASVSALTARREALLRKLS